MLWRALPFPIGARKEISITLRCCLRFQCCLQLRPALRNKRHRTAIRGSRNLKLRQKHRAISRRQIPQVSVYTLRSFIGACIELHVHIKSSPVFTHVLSRKPMSPSLSTTTSRSSCLKSGATSYDLELTLRRMFPFSARNPRSRSVRPIQSGGMCFPFLARWRMTTRPENP